jgi:hypothetical protein
MDTEMKKGSSTFSVEGGEMFVAASLVFNPNGIEALSPRVARNELPWVKIERKHNPARVESVS